MKIEDCSQGRRTTVAASSKMRQAFHPSPFALSPFRGEGVSSRCSLEEFRGLVAGDGGNDECRMTNRQSCRAAREVLADGGRSLSGGIDDFSTRAVVFARGTKSEVNRLFPAYFPLKFSCFFPDEAKRFRLIPAIPHPEMRLSAGNCGYLRINAGNLFNYFLRGLPKESGAGRAGSALTNCAELG